MTIMNEIVGESGEQGEGCLSSIAIAFAGLLVLFVVLLLLLPPLA